MAESDSLFTSEDEYYDEFEDEDDNDVDDESEDTENEFLDVTEDFNFEDNRKVIQGLEGEMRDIKDKLLVKKEKKSKFDKEIEKINNEISKENNKIKELQREMEAARHDRILFGEEYMVEKEKWFGSSGKMKTLHDEAKKKEDENKVKINGLLESISNKNRKVESTNRVRNTIENDMEKLRIKEEEKKNQIKEKKREKRKAERQEISLLPKPFQSCFRSLDMKKAKGHYMNKIKCLEPLPEECRFVNILLVGATAAGKSSFINTCATALMDNNQMVHVSSTRENSAGSATMRLIPEELKINKDNNLTVTMFDCRGLSEAKLQNFGIQEMEMIINGHIKSSAEIKDAVSMKEDEQIYIKEPKMKHEMHCIVYVIKASREGVHIDLGIKRELMRLLYHLTPISKPQFILLTHMDEVVPNDDVANLFRYPCARRVWKEASKITQVTPGYILLAANYKFEHEPNDVQDALCLFNLNRIISNARDYVERKIREREIHNRYAE